MQHTLTLTESEVQLILRALSRITPYGGGSAPLALQFKLVNETGVVPAAA